MRRYLILGGVHRLGLWLGVILGFRRGGRFEVVVGGVSAYA